MLEKLLDRWFLVPIAPGMEVVIAALIVGVVAFVLRRRLRITAGTWPRASTGLRLAAVAVILAWIMDLAITLLTGGPWEVRRWEYALPLVVATTGILLTLVATQQRVRRTGEPAGIGLRRTWTSFTSRVELCSLVVVTVLIVSITIACGLASSPDDLGRYSILVNDVGGYGSFYGWAYGLPVLAAMIALLAVLWITLHRIAVPPFSNPSTVELEIAHRRTASTATVGVAGSALVLTLGAVVASIGYSGGGTSGVGIPGVGDFIWRAGFASFSEFFIWSGWALEVGAFVGLILLALGFVPGKLFAMGAQHEAEKAGAL